MSASDEVVAALAAMFAPFSVGEKAALVVEVVEPEAMPDAYRKLLVHKRHMTAALEEFHGRRVGVCVAEQKLEAAIYTRQSLLFLEGTDDIVQFAIMRINLSLCSKSVREEVISGETPLGEILIQHKVLRRVEPWAFFKVTPTALMKKFMRLDKSAVLYGRLATIFYEGKKAIEVLEIPTAGQ